MWRARGSASLAELAIAAATLALLLAVPRLTRRIPAPLVAIPLAGVLAAILNHVWPSHAVATIASRFHATVGGRVFSGVPPFPPLPMLPWAAPGPGGAPLHLSLTTLRELLSGAFAVAMLGGGANDVGSSRFHLLKACDDSLKRLGTDYIDIYQMHGFDATTPVEETLRALDDLITAGKIRYIGCSNFSGWHLMKSLAVSERYGLARYVAHQAHYSLVGRDYEWELMPLALDQGVGAIVWSPLGWGRLTGKIRRGQPRPEVSRLNTQLLVDIGPPVPEEYPFQGRGYSGGTGPGDGQDHPADCAELGGATSVRGKRDHWRPQRGTAARQPGCGGLEPDRRADRATRRRQCAGPGLSLLASTPVHGTQSVTGGVATGARGLSSAALVQINSQFGQNREAQLLRLRAGQSARMREGHLEGRLNPGGARGQHVDSIGKVDRLLHIVRDRARRYGAPARRMRSSSLRMRRLISASSAENGSSM